VDDTRSLTSSPAHPCKVNYHLLTADNECLPQLLLVLNFVHCYSYKCYVLSDIIEKHKIFAVLVTGIYLPAVRSVQIIVVRYTNFETGFEIPRIRFLILYDDVNSTYMTSVHVVCVINCRCRATSGADKMHCGK